jgi:aminoglycoside 3-N-acetyltransferase
LSAYTVDDLVKNLKGAGVTNGDTLLVRAAMRSVGAENKQTLISALLEAVGKEGTIVGLSFSKSYLFPFIKRGNYTSSTPTNSGGFSASMLQYPGAVRSHHPTNSYVAIGKNANLILDGHDHTAMSYSPMEKLIDLEGKMIIIGCIESSPGFTTVHFAQEKLGLTKKTLLKNLLGTGFELDGERKKFYRSDLGGCSAGFSRFYAHYLNQGALGSMKIGGADSLIIKAKAAYEIEYELIENDNKALLCTSDTCFTCRATWWFNLSDVLPFLYYSVLKKLRII